MLKINNSLLKREFSFLFFNRILESSIFNLILLLILFLILEFYKIIIYNLILPIRGDLLFQKKSVNKENSPERTKKFSCVTSEVVSLYSLFRNFNGIK
jgi:hypothetical protein